MRPALLLCFAAVSLAQPPAKPDDVLARAQARLADAAAAILKYTCTQTVDRRYFREARQAPRACDVIVANRRKGRTRPVLMATDRLRFDVEVTDGGYEIYAWPGAARIATEKIEEMAGGGPLGTGPFGPFLIDIFANPAVQFQYLGTSPLLEYRYRVPLEASHYRVQAGVKWRMTGYDGTFRLDPASALLKQLTVRTLELPADTGSCEATTATNFELLRIGDGEYLIPRRTNLQVIGRDAGFTESTTVYSACHEFRGESTVRFDNPAPQASSGPTFSGVVHAPALPPGLPVQLALDTEIDTDRAAAGDPVSARLDKPLVDPANQRLLAPAGAVVRGRITHMEHHIEGENYFLIGFTFETLETPAATLPLNIVLDSPHQVQDPRTRTGRSVVTTESRTGFHGGGTLLLPTRGSRCLVPRGYPSTWITLAQP
ncbi:MAG: hypothetical protein P4L56_03565 [Candidatus Sulfopaludibacter sp.]|nr:hypothetical protein [Candidatus Sulfopaludibacter sp.]